jgi:hypothetical protein
MLFTVKNSVNCSHGDEFVAILKKTGLKVFAKTGNWRVIAVPGLSEEVLKAITTRWYRASVIDQMEPINGSFDPDREDFADVDTVLV